MRKQGYVLYVFAYVLDILAALSYAKMEAASGRLHNSRPVAFDRPPSFGIHYGAWTGGKYVQNVSK